MVWKHFKQDGGLVICKICDAKLRYHGSTTTMRAHLGTHPSGSGSSSASAGRSGGASRKQRQTTFAEYAKRPMTNSRRKQITNLLVNFIVKDTRPLSAVSGRGFKAIIRFFEPDYVFPSHATLWKYIKLQYDQLQEQLRDDVKDKSVSLTTDLWTSTTMQPYITVTAHYLSDTWEMQAKVLCTRLMDERHTAANIAQRLTDVIQEWGMEQVFCAVHDNASSMNLAMSLCEKVEEDIGCTGHTLQLAIKKGLELPEVEKTIDAARRVVSHFRHSSVATCALQKRQDALKVKENRLQNDCATRWNSTFTMLERLNEQRIPVQAVLEDETVTKPATKKKLQMRASQWELIQQLLPVLRPLAKATTIMCAELHVGLSFIYPVILNLLSEGPDGVLRDDESDIAAARNFKSTVRQQLRTRFKLDSEEHDLTASIPILACMLDPRFKDLLFLPERDRPKVYISFI